MSRNARLAALAAAVVFATAPLAAQLHAAVAGPSSNVQPKKPAKPARLTAAQKTVLASIANGTASHVYNPGLLATAKSGAAKGLWTYQHNAHDNTIDFTPVKA